MSMSTARRQLQPSTASPCPADSMKYSASTRLPMRRPCMSVKATTTVSISPFLTAAPSCSLVSMSAPRAGARHKAFEQLPGPRKISGQLFGVALHGNDQAVVRLEPFDRAVVSGRGLPQPRGHGPHCLVVKAVDPDLTSFSRMPQLGGWIDRGRVGEVLPAKRADLVAIEVLQQGSTHRHVDHLLATADTKYRDLLVPGQPEKPDLGLVQLGVDGPDFRVGLLTVKSWIDIPPSRQQQPVELIDRTGAGRKVDGLCAGRLHRPAIRQVVISLPPRAGRYSDLRTRGVMRVPIRRRRVRLRSWQALPASPGPWVP